MSLNRFEEYFNKVPKDHTIHKWLHYLPIYDRYFKPFMGRNPVILEIGVYKGGSLDMWNYYFEGQCQIYGLDINPDCKALEKDNIKILIGDQGDPETMKTIIETVPSIDILIDDGSHQMKDLIATFEGLYKHVKAGGFYLLEDLHTCYWPEYGGSLKGPNTFIEYSKRLIDELNGFHIPSQSQSQLSKTLASLHYYDSVLVIEKCLEYVPPVAVIKHPL